MSEDKSEVPDFLRKILSKPSSDLSEEDKLLQEQREKKELQSLALIREKAQLQEKRTITADHIHHQLMAPEVIGHISKFFKRKIHADKKPSQTDEEFVQDLLRKTTGTIDHSVPEQGFQITESYQLSSTIVSGLDTGTSMQVQHTGTDSILDPNRFLLLEAHHEPEDKGRLHRIPPLSSIIGSDDTEGDLVVLAHRRQAHREDFGVDIRPISVIVQAGNNFGRLLLIQEKGDVHATEQLRELDTKLAAFPPKTPHEEYIRTVHEAGYNFWASPLDKKVTIPSLEDLKSFEFTPTNLPEME